MRKANKKKKGRRVFLDLAPVTERPPQLHPCLAQYGGCMFGDKCHLSIFPAGACIYHIQGQFGRGQGCAYGETCQNEHLDVVEYQQEYYGGQPDLPDLPVSESPTATLSSPLSKPLHQPKQTQQAQAQTQSQQRPLQPTPSAQTAKQINPWVQNKQSLMQLPVMQQTQIKATKQEQSKPLQPPVLLQSQAVPFQTQSKPQQAHPQLHPLSTTPTASKPIPLPVNAPEYHPQSPQLRQLNPRKQTSDRTNPEEIEELNAKFGSSCVNVVNDSEIQVFIKPANPKNFPWNVHALILHFTLPALYPTQLPDVEVMNFDFPEELKESIRQRIKAHSTTLQPTSTVDEKIEHVVYRACVWANQNLESLMVNEQVTKQYHTSLSPMPRYDTFTMSESDEDYSAITNAPYNPVLTFFNSDDTDNDNEGDESEHQVPDQIAAIAANTPTTTPTSEPHHNVNSTQGVQILCEGLQLVNVGVLHCYQLKATISCRRCKLHADVGIGENQSFTSVCEKCHNPYYLFWQPEIMHASNNVLGYLHTMDVILFDLLPSCFKIICLHCNKEMIDRKMMFNDHSWRKNCESCHNASSAKIESVDIKKRAGMPNPGNGTIPKIDPNEIFAKKGKKNTRHQDEGIFSGQALPNYGACKHYKKSKRWLRFPCCSKVYPCNHCHDLAANHPADWANKMICGYCSTEQPFTDDFCCKCGAGLTTTKQSVGHWNGGDGCRDQTRMSKKDNKKYRGQQKTTASTHPHLTHTHHPMHAAGASRPSHASTYDPIWSGTPIISSAYSNKR